MKFFLVGFVLIPLLLCLPIAYIWIGEVKKRDPETYVLELNIEHPSFADLESIDEEDLAFHCYHRHTNKRAFAFSNPPFPLEADERNEVPAFICGADLFIVTYKWVNHSNGLAVSKRSDFATHVQEVDPRIQVTDLGNGIFRWHFDK